LLGREQAKGAYGGVPRIGEGQGKKGRNHCKKERSIRLNDQVTDISRKKALAQEENAVWGGAGERRMVSGGGRRVGGKGGCQRGERERVERGEGKRRKWKGRGGVELWGVGGGLEKRRRVEIEKDKYWRGRQPYFLNVIH